MTASLYTEVETKLLSPDPDQPRNRFDEAALAALTENIRHRGILQPLLIREGQKKGRYIIVDGERRWRAAKAAKLKSVPALVVTAGETAQLRMDQVAANQLRENLSTMDLARTLVGLREKQRMSDNDIAAYLDKQGIPALTSAEMADLMALTQLPEWAQEMVDAGTVAAKDARILNMARSDPPKVLKTAADVLTKRIHWAGTADSDDVVTALGTGYEAVKAPDLTRNESYYSNPVRFKVSQVCRGCADRRRFDGADFCMGPACFAENQKKATEAGLLAGGKRPAKAAKPVAAGSDGEAPSEEKQEQRPANTREKLAALLDERLREWILDQISDNYLLHHNLALYLAAGMPNGVEGWERDEITLQAHSWESRNARQHLQAAAKSIGHVQLRNFLDLGVTDAGIHTLAEAAVRMMTQAQVRDMAQWMELDIGDFYRVDAEHLALLRKPDLLVLAEKGLCHDFDKLTAKALRTCILETPGAVESIGCPPDIREIFEAPIVIDTELGGKETTDQEAAA